MLPWAALALVAAPPWGVGGDATESGSKITLLTKMVQQQQQQQQQQGGREMTAVCTAVLQMLLHLFDAGTCRWCWQHALLWV